MKTLFILLVAAFLSAPAPRPQDDGGGQACNKGGEEVRCPDGHYHDYHDGHIQPDSCDNFKTGKAEVHDCECERATTCHGKFTPGPKCKTECRDHACACVKNCS
jgi:hypothetical protein